MTVWLPVERGELSIERPLPCLRLVAVYPTRAAAHKPSMAPHPEILPPSPSQLVFAFAAKKVVVQSILERIRQGWPVSGSRRVQSNVGST